MDLRVNPRHIILDGYLGDLDRKISLAIKTEILELIERVRLENDHPPECFISPGYGFPEDLAEALTKYIMDRD